MRVHRSRSGLAFVSNGTDGMHIVDVTSPGHAVRRGSFEPPLGVFAVDTAGPQLAFAAGGGAGLLALDVSSPDDPKEIGFYGTGENEAVDVRVENGIAYVATGPGGLQLFDVTNPRSLRKLGEIVPPLGVQAVDVQDGIAYVASGEAGVLVIDAKTPSAPRQITFWGTAPHAAKDVKIDKNRLFVAAGEGGLHVLDATVPSSLKLASRFEPPLGVHGIDVVGDRAFVAGHGAGLLVLDIADLAAVQQIGFYGWGAEEARGVAGGDHYAFVAASDGGLKVVLLDCERASQRAPERRP